MATDAAATLEAVERAYTAGEMVVQIRPVTAGMASIGMLSSCYARCASDELRGGDGRCYPLVGDEPEHTAPSADSDEERGEARVRARTEECAEGVWTYLVDAGPSPGAATLEVTDAARSEPHPMKLSDASHWQLSATLPVVPVAAQESAISTAFPCEAGDTLTWRLQLWDAAGLPSDCTVWGADPARLTDEWCRPW